MKIPSDRLNITKPSMPSQFARAETAGDALLKLIAAGDDFDLQFKEIVGIEDQARASKMHGADQRSGCRKLPARDPIECNRRQVFAGIGGNASE